MRDELYAKNPHGQQEHYFQRMGPGYKWKVGTLRCCFKIWKVAQEKQW